MASAVPKPKMKEVPLSEVKDDLSRLAAHSSHPVNADARAIQTEGIS